LFFSRKWEGARELQAFAEAWQLPVATALQVTVVDEGGKRHAPLVGLHK